MKKLFVLFSLSLFIVSCGAKNDAPETTSSSTSKPVVLSIPAGYSSSFTMGNPDYAAMVVQGSWKDWQDNKMTNMKSWVADSVVAYESDNKTITGVDSLSADWNRARAKYTSVVDSIDAAMPVFSTDRKENWVLIWATEYSTDATGKKDTMPVMETWRINKDGKADMLLQFDRHTRKK